MFRQLRRAGENVQLAGEHCYRLLASRPDNAGLRAEITRCEHAGDEITRSIIQRLLKQRLPRVDRRDIHALAEALDDIVDDIEEVSEELAVYNIEAPMEQALEQAAAVRDSGRAVRGAIDRVGDLEAVEAAAIEMRRLEHEGDRIYRQAVASLFEGGIDPMLVIRWKDIFEGLENAIDRCRRAMDIVHAITLKHA
jgi:uncharacterized protein